MSFKFTIKTPEREVFEGEVSAVSLDTEDGRVQVLTGHADFMTTLQYSVVRVDMENRSVTYAARSGIFSFDHARGAAQLLALYCEEESEVNMQTATEYLKFLSDELVQGDLSSYQVKYLKGEKLAVEKQVKGR